MADTTTSSSTDPSSIDIGVGGVITPNATSPQPIHAPTPSPTPPPDTPPAPPPDSPAVVSDSTSTPATSDGNVIDTVLSAIGNVVTTVIDNIGGGFSSANSSQSNPWGPASYDYQQWVPNSSTNLATGSAVSLPAPSLPENSVQGDPWDLGQTTFNECNPVKGKKGPIETALDNLCRGLLYNGGSNSGKSRILGMQSQERSQKSQADFSAMIGNLLNQQPWKGRTFQCQDGIHGTNGADYGEIVNGIIKIDTKAITNDALNPPPGLNHVSPDNAIQEVLLHELLHLIPNALGQANELDELVFEKYLFVTAQTRIFAPSFNTTEVATGDAAGRALAPQFGAIDPIDLKDTSAAYYGKFFIYDRSTKEIFIRAANGRGSVVKF